MLCLSRKKGEKIIIGDNYATIVVVDIRGDKVRLGLEFPKEVKVHREEVYNEIQDREKSALPLRESEEIQEVLPDQIENNPS